MSACRTAMRSMRGPFEPTKIFISGRAGRLELHFAMGVVVALKVDRPVPDKGRDDQECFLKSRRSVVKRKAKSVILGPVPPQHPDRG